MKRSVFPCHKCGSTELRRSQIHSVREWLQAMTGRYPFRCLRCQERFAVNIWLWSRVGFAKCPKCLRAELSGWPPRSYRLPLWKNLLVAVGAHRYRCKACRYRFVSFLPVESMATSSSGKSDSPSDDRSVGDDEVIAAAQEIAVEKVFKTEAATKL